MSAAKAKELVDLIRQDMHKAMKEKKRVELEELRSILARISNAEAISQDDHKYDSAVPVAEVVVGVGGSEVPRKTLTPTDVDTILYAEKQEIEAALAYTDKKTPYAADLEVKLDVIKKYMPKL